MRATKSDGSYLSEIPLDTDENIQSVDLTQSDADVITDDDISLGSMVSSLAMITRVSVHETLVYTVSHWKVVIFGQFLSFTLAAAGAAQATLHFECSLSAPAFSSALFYSFLALFLIPLHRKGRRIREIDDGDGDGDENVASVVGHAFVAEHWFLGVIPLEVGPWAYLLVAFLDVQGNYLTVLAFRYTALTSVTLLDALAIPSAVILSRLFLRRRHTSVHLVAIFLCMSGVLYNAMADYESNVWADADRNDGAREYPHKIAGDTMAIMGGVIFGANDVLAEALLRKTGGETEFLGMLGCLAAVISSIQALVLERENIADFFRRVEEPDGKVCSMWSGFWILCWFILANMINYIGSARFLLISEATFLNLSLLTADLWSVVFSVVAEGIVPQPLFWVALTMIVSGVITYELAPSPIVSDGAEQDLHKNDDGVILTRELSERSQRDVALTL